MCLDTLAIARAVVQRKTLIAATVAHVVCVCALTGSIAASEPWFQPHHQVAKEAAKSSRTVARLPLASATLASEMSMRVPD